LIFEKILSFFLSLIYYDTSFSVGIFCEAAERSRVVYISVMATLASTTFKKDSKYIMVGHGSWPFVYNYNSIVD